MNPPLRVLLTGGGTGGHIYPLLSLAAAFEALPDGAEVTFVGERGRMEAELVPHAGYAIELLDLPPANAPKTRKLLASGRWLSGYRSAARLIAASRAEVVIGAGGQVCAPVLLAARRAGCRRVLLEPNAIPGRANRWLARWADPDLIAVLMPAARSWFPGRRVEELGYPIRPEILTAEREGACRELGLDPARRVVLVFGGSLGSQRINDAVAELLPRLSAGWAQGLQFLHLGGRVNARRVPGEQIADLVVDYQYRDYLHEMGQALAAADLVVGRAGAMSLAELTARGLPAILVPFPAAADDHQTHNAAWMAAAGAAVVVPDGEFTGGWLGEELANLLTAPATLDGMAAASRTLGRREAAAELVGRILELVREER